MVGLRVRFLAMALLVPATALVPIAAFGEPKRPSAKKAEKAEKAGEDRFDPDNVTAISKFMDSIAKGTERFVAKDHTGAVDLYRKAIQLSPRNPLGHYLLAEAYLASGNAGEAEAAIQQAVEVSDAKNPSLRGQVLFLQADVFERQKKWGQAKTAWQAYAEHAAKFADAGAFPQSSAERIKALQKVLDLEKAYVGVRERIASEKADAAKAAASTSPLAPPKKK